MEKHFYKFIFSGLFVLILAGIFYVIYRPESLIVLQLFGDTRVSDPMFMFFGTGSLPSFLHTLAFCLLTTAFVKTTRNNVIFVSLFWFLINASYELFSASQYAEQVGMQFYGDLYDVISSFIGAFAYFAFTFHFCVKLNPIIKE